MSCATWRVTLVMTAHRGHITHDKRRSSAWQLGVKQKLTLVVYVVDALTLYLFVDLTKVWAGQVNCRHRTRAESVYYSTASLRVGRLWFWCRSSRVHTASFWLREQTMGTAWTEEASTKHLYQWRWSDTFLVIQTVCFGTFNGTFTLRDA